MSNKNSGEVSVTLPGDVEFVCAAPGADAWDRYLDKVARGGNKRSAQKEVILGSCTSHETSAVTAIIDRFPAIVDPMCSQLDALCGSDHEFTTSLEDFTFSTTVDGEELVFDGPTGGQYETLKANMEEPKLKPSAVIKSHLRELCRDKDAFDAIVLRYPTIIGPAMPAVTAVSGADLEIKVKKG